jgi:hypothetical protein
MSENQNEIDTRPTHTEMINSLTGWDEIAISKHFGRDYFDLTGSNVVRALAFVQERRNGLSDVDAKEAALKLTIGACNDLFQAEPEDEDPDAPDSAAGKEPSAPE